mgnify:FL=1
MTKDELVEKVARIIAPSRWRVFDAELARVKRKYSGQNVAYDPKQFKDRASMELARAALAIAMPAAFEMAAEVAEKVIIDARTGEIDNDLRSVSYTLVQEMRAEEEKWK